MHVSIDIETWGTRPGCAIRSIGAAKFDLNTGKMGDTFYINLNDVWQFSVGMEQDASTVEWWSKQPVQTQQRINSAKVHPFDALQWFNEYLADAEAVWGYGSDFDIALLAALYRVTGLEPAWKYWHVRCGRTLCALADVAPERGDGHHMADIDAQRQAEAISRAWRTIKGV